MIKKKKYQSGGKIKGPSHDKGGVDAVVGGVKPVELEGNEIIINVNHNGAASKHEDKLLALNDNPDDYEIVKKGSKLTSDSEYNYRTHDARKRRK